MATRLSQGPLQVLTLDLPSINSMLMQVRRELDELRGLRGVTQLFNTTLIDGTAVPVWTPAASSVAAFNASLAAVTVARASVTAASSKISLGGTPTASVLSAFSIDVVESALDHGALGGLADDDHAIYLLASAAGSRALFATNWTDLTDLGATTLHSHAAASESTDVANVDGVGSEHVWERIFAGTGINVDVEGTEGTAIRISASASGIDHGGLAGLADDDHPQYQLAANDAEAAQDAVGTILVDSTSVDFTYSDATPSITAAVLPAGVDHNSLANLAVGDVHTQYRLESEDHSHQTTGLQAGTLDHGAALTGLADDDHSLYLLASDATSRALFATNWLDLTDLGATTLHSHAGSSEATDVANVDGAGSENAWELVLYGLQEFSYSFKDTVIHTLGQNRFRYLNSLTNVRNAADQTALAVNAWTTVTFDTEDFDTDAIHASATPTRLTAPLTGKYLVIGEIYLDGGGTVTPTELDCRVLLNGGTVTRYAQHTVSPPANGILAVIGVTALISLTAGDYLEIQALIGATSGTFVIKHSTTTPNLTFFALAYLGE